MVLPKPFILMFSLVLSSLVFAGCDTSDPESTPLHSDELSSKGVAVDGSANQKPGICVSYVVDRDSGKTDRYGTDRMPVDSLDADCAVVFDEQDRILNSQTPTSSPDRDWKDQGIQLGTKVKQTRLIRLTELQEILEDSLGGWDNARSQATCAETAVPTPLMGLEKENATVGQYLVLVEQTCKSSCKGLGLWIQEKSELQQKACDALEALIER